MESRTYVTYEEALRHFGQELSELRAQRGAPSFDRMRARGLKALGDTAGACSKGTMSKVFAGGQFISLDKLIWLVRTVMSWDEYGEECAPPGRRDEELTPWRSRWQSLNALRAQARRHPAPPSPRPSDPRPVSFGHVDVLIGHAGPVVALAFSPDGGRLVTASDDGAVRLWDLATHKVTSTIRTRYGSALSVAFSPDGGRVVFGNRSGRVLM
ncbi:hypothetical protein H8N01_28340 [Streptomyces sp. AC536]|uniref:WD40 repeat domain-containing protein n=1 Tax=Streptomyces buecherae TaxID=2763006 RepID=UPI00164D220B|nr:hypothetical protein [Streptomyces buecherae]MBC3986384.1 hypothetical protein [Streptomyces buecherae]QNJ41475.1 hypothetical protein H7H31_18005 [Streptomyces buecherae]